MVLSVANPRHPLAYTQSCYGHVCHEIRENETLQPSDEIVLLGATKESGAIHSILIRGDQIMVDACSDSAALKDDVYELPATKGALPMKMHVIGRMSLQEFGERCLALASQPPGGQPTPPKKG
jgi:hypothetical protein